jgi:hercynine metabolism protein
MSRSGGDGADWLDQLEAKREQTFEAFLRANPAQQELLQEQEQRDRQQKAAGRRRAQRAEAELLRQELLNLAAEIQQWQQRVERARTAGACDLANRAQLHLDQLMERGRSRWQRLEQLGRDLEQESAKTAAEPSLEQAWAQFERDQELERLREQRRQRR